MKIFLLLTAAVATVLLLVSFSKAEIPQGKNIKTQPNQLSPLEKLLIRTFHPEIPLNKILAEDNGNGNTIQDDYRGDLEWFHIELPLFLLQLNKMGDEILFPTFQFEFGWWSCFIGVCDGFLSSYNIMKPVMKNVTSATLTGSVNGTQLRLSFHIGNIEGHCPDFVLEDTDYGQDPPVTSETTIWNNATVFITNNTLETTATISLGPTGLQVSNLNVEWSMDDFRVRYENGTHIFPDGRQEEWGAVEDKLHETWLEIWNGEGAKEFVQDSIQEWLNCFLSNGRNGGVSCNLYLEEPLHRQSFAELIHAFGLNGLNAARNSMGPLNWL